MPAPVPRALRPSPAARACLYGSPSVHGLAESSSALRAGSARNALIASPKEAMTLAAAQSVSRNSQRRSGASEAIRFAETKSRRSCRQCASGASDASRLWFRFRSVNDSIDATAGSSRRRLRDSERSSRRTRRCAARARAREGEARASARARAGVVRTRAGRGAGREPASAATSRRCPCRRALARECARPPPRPSTRASAPRSPPSSSCSRRPWARPPF